MRRCRMLKSAAFTLAPKGPGSGQLTGIDTGPERRIDAISAIIRALEHRQETYMLF